MEAKTIDERRQVLSQLAQMRFTGGGRIESQTDNAVVIVQGKPVNHILHLLLTVFTFGLWLPIWLILILVGGEKREIITIDEYGQVVCRKA